MKDFVFSQSLSEYGVMGQSKYLNYRDLGRNFEDFNRARRVVVVKAALYQSFNFKHGGQRRRSLFGGWNYNTLKMKCVASD